MSKKPSPRAVGESDRYTGERIREARVTARMSQSNLAENLGVSFQQIQKYEKGVNRLSATRLSQIAKATGKDPMFFLPGSTAHAGREDATMSKFLTTKEGQIIASKFLKLTPVMRTMIVDLVGHFARTV